MNRKPNPDFVNRTVVVTGIGMISPLGISASRCWEAGIAGKSGIRQITKFDASGCKTRIGGQLPDAYFDLESRLISKRTFKQTTLLSRLTRICAEDAITDSQIDVGRIDLKRAGVIIGASGSSAISLNDSVANPVDKFAIIREMINAIPARISLDFGFQGPSYTVSASSESGLCAITKAYDLIRTGGADVVVAGGADTLLCKTYIDYFNSINLLSTENDIPEQAVRPFDRQRKGSALSDGAGVVVLESHEHAMQRRARIYAHMKGYSASWAPLVTARSMADTMFQTLGTSALLPEDIEYISAYGTATIENDRMESQAIQMVFNGQSANLLISSLKSMIGHTMGASGAIQFGLTAMMIFYEKILPTINYISPDPECSLNYVPNQVISRPGLKAALVNSFGFKGHHYVLSLIRDPKMMTQ